MYSMSLNNSFEKLNVLNWPIGYCLIGAKKRYTCQMPIFSNLDFNYAKYFIFKSYLLTVVSSIEMCNSKLKLWNVKNSLNVLWTTLSMISSTINVATFCKMQLILLLSHYSNCKILNCTWDSRYLGIVFDKSLSVS